MDFLRRLAPLPEGDTTRAVAALPSRFASESPLRAPAVAAKSKPISKGVALARIPRLTSASGTMHTSADSAGAHRPLQPEPAGQSAIERLVTDPRPLAMSRPADAAPAHREGRYESIAPRSTVRPQTQGIDAEGPRQVMHSGPRGPELEAYAGFITETSAVAAAPVQPQRMPSVGSAPVVPTRMVSPLSEAALATRTTQAREQRPVIHVTIDRIEVRAPASPERRAAPVKPRAASPTVSLSDYLRARGPTQPGGAS